MSDLEYVKSKAFGSWETEASWGKGNLCYAAAEKALYQAIKGETRTQAQIAHQQWVKYYTKKAYNPEADEFVTQYAEFLGNPAAEAVPSWDEVDAGIKDIVLGSFLGKFWGNPDLSGLSSTGPVVYGVNDAFDVSQTIDAGGLVLAGGSHCLICYAYDKDSEGMPKQFWVWDPKDGDTYPTAADEGSLTGLELYFVTP